MMSALSPELSKLLCCPETRQALAPASAAQLARLNERMARGELKNRAGKTVSGPADGALLRADGRAAYVVRGGIPVLLVEEAVMIEPGALD